MEENTATKSNGAGALGASHESAVLERYGKAAQSVEACLCLPVSYDRELLQVIPDEILEKDYGCGDPSRHVRPGDTVLDLGSGSGKSCYIMSQIVGPRGRVIGVDFNPPMLELARKHQKAIAERIGYLNVDFRRGKIQDLKTDVDLLDAYLAEHPVRSAADLGRLEEYQRLIQREQPLVPDASIDVIVSNCVLNLVRAEDKKSLFAEMYRVLRRGGRIAISDIVSDEPVPAHLAADAGLWSACVSGALQEEALLRAFEEAKFHGIRIEDFQSTPYQVVEGIEFRSVTVTAYKGKEGPCLEGNQAVIYRGPWKQVVDDDGHTLPRGARIAVCEKTFDLYSKAPYEGQFVMIAPEGATAGGGASPFDCSRDRRRHPRETKAAACRVAESAAQSCSPGSGSSCCP